MPHGHRRDGRHLQSNYYFIAVKLLSWLISSCGTSLRICLVIAPGKGVHVTWFVSMEDGKISSNIYIP